MPKAAMCKYVSKGLLHRKRRYVNRWNVYSWLKGCRIPQNVVEMVESTPIRELREGVIEFLLVKLREGGQTYGKEG